MRYPSVVAAAACGAVLLATPGRASPPPVDEIRWDAIVAYEGRAAFERIRAGHPDAATPGLQLVGVDQAGDVVLVRRDGEKARSEVIHRHGAELTGVAIADLDPQVPGEEIYVDSERGHTLLAADVVPGNDADVLVLGGFSKRVTVLVARKAR